MNLNRYFCHIAIEHEVNMKSEEVNIYDYEDARGYYLDLLDLLDDEGMKRLPCDCG